MAVVPGVARLADAGTGPGVAPEERYVKNDRLLVPILEKQKLSSSIPLQHKYRYHEKRFFSLQQWGRAFFPLSLLSFWRNQTKAKAIGAKDTMSFSQSFLTFLKTLKTFDFSCCLLPNISIPPWGSRKPVHLLEGEIRQQSWKKKKKKTE